MGVDCDNVVCFLCQELFHRSFEHTNITPSSGMIICISFLSKFDSMMTALELAF